MRKRHAVIGGVIIGSLVTAYLGAHPSTAARNGLSLAGQQDPSDEVQTNTMRPVIRGRSMAANRPPRSRSRVAQPGCCIRSDFQW